MNKEKLREKIYDMSNSYLPLNLFFNDIELNKDKYYNKERAFEDLERIADFILDLQAENIQLKERQVEND